jgi:hypothetical protein
MDNMDGAGAVPTVYPGPRETLPQKGYSLTPPSLHERIKQMRDSVRRCKETFLRTQAFGRRF